MNISIKQFGSLEKVRDMNIMDEGHLAYIMALKGEKVSYQVALSSEGKKSETPYRVECSIESALGDCIKLFSVENAMMDTPARDGFDDDFITKEPGVMPDILVPMEERNYIVGIQGIKSIWVDVNIPKDIKAGSYTIKFTAKSFGFKEWESFEVSTIMYINVVDCQLPETDIVYTEWLHTDCIANYHDVEVYSEKHWYFIDKYIEAASKMGVNMILTPVFTPSLDTGVGYERRSVQLVDIEKNGDKYSFDFSKLGKWIEICKKNNIKNYEISSLYTQWGVKFTPNIYVTENGEKIRMFGWHVEGTDERYSEFLKQMLPALVEYLREKGVVENTYFHLSDEPTEKHFDAYKKAYETVKPLIGDCKIFEPCSSKIFYENNVMDIPVVSTDRIMPFVEAGVDPLFVYYCGAQNNLLPNRLLAMPLYRCKIIGMLIYKYNFKGFLYWGLNYYNGGTSEYTINPYMTTSADGLYLSGGSFVVYPGKEYPYLSLRAKAMRDAMQDISVLKVLEKYIGRDEVLKLIEEEAGMELTLTQYPRNSTFHQKFAYKVKGLIAENVAKQKQGE